MSRSVLPTTEVDIEASYAAQVAADFPATRGGLVIWKLADDLERYRRVIVASSPDVLIETGTHQAGFTTWAVETFGLKVITVDVDAAPGRPRQVKGASIIRGDSVNPRTLDKIAAKIPDRARVMVSLDSDHTAAHVIAEIANYGPLVTSGCYLVVEDTLADLVGPDRAHLFGARIPIDGGPLLAVHAKLVDHPWWHRDREVENLTRISQSPAGWWRRG